MASKDIIRRCRCGWFLVRISPLSCTAGSNVSVMVQTKCGKCKREDSITVDAKDKEFSQRK